MIYDPENHNPIEQIPAGVRPTCHYVTPETGKVFRADSGTLYFRPNRAYGSHGQMADQPIRRVSHKKRDGQKVSARWNARTIRRNNFIVANKL